MKKSFPRLMAITLAAACAVSPAMAADACLMKSQIRSWTVPDNQHLIITDAASHKYSVALLGACTGLQFTEGLGVDTKGNSLCMEKGDAITFPQGSGGLNQRCVITGITAVGS